MASLNQCNFIGNLGKDPELRHTAQGAAVCSLSIGVSEKWKDKQTGQQNERTEWVRVSAFGKLAEIMGQYLKKGSSVFVSGRMQTRKWQDQNGQDRYTTEIVANEMQMLDSRGGNGNPSSQGKRGQQSSAPPMPDDFDPDIPF